jgi:hypothetical protein
MKAEWTNNTDKFTCLCCGQIVPRAGRAVLTEQEAEMQLTMLETLGYTREGLLTQHRDQIDYQLPGFAAWLEGQ